MPFNTLNLSEWKETILKRFGQSLATSLIDGKEKILNHSQTVEHYLNEIYDILRIIDNFRLNKMKNQVLESVQPMKSESLNAHGRKVKHLGNIESKFKQLNFSRLAAC